MFETWRGDADDVARLDEPSRDPRPDPFADLPLEAPRRPRPPDWGEEFIAGLDGRGPDPEPGWGASRGDTAVTESPEIVALRKAVAAVAAIDPAQLDPAQALADAAGVLNITQSLRVERCRGSPMCRTAGSTAWTAPPRRTAG